jgi:putative ABC transport system permease protein
MRQVVGATRIDLVMQYLFEAFLLTSCALFCMLGLALLLRFTLAGPLQTGVEILLFGAGSPQFWIVTFGVVVTVSVVAGLYPALGTMRVRPAQAVKTSRSGRGSTWVSSLLVGVQFFAASFLLIAVLVMSKQNEVIERNAYALTPDPVIAIANDFRKSGIDLAAFKAALANESEIKSVTASMFPLGIAPNDNAPITETPDPLARKLTVAVQLIDYDFFETLGVGLRAGRTFDRQYGDDISDAERERAGNIVIDMALVRRLGWASAEDALGKVLYVPGIANGLDRKPGPSTIVGVVEDKPLYAINFSGGEGSIYQLVPRLAAYPMVRISRGDMRAARAAVEDAWDRVAPGIALQASFLDEQFERGLFVFKLIAGIFSFLAMFSICIASVGLIGMATHMASRRTHEIGVRKTLGASVAGILRMLLTDFSKPVLIANLLAWPLGFIAARLYLNLFVERAPQTVLPYIASMLFTLIVVWAAVAAPAIRAARVRSAGVLRYE